MQVHVLLVTGALAFMLLTSTFGPATADHI